MTGLVRNKTYSEELPVVWLYPKKWNGRVILWLDDSGKSAHLRRRDGSLKPAIAQLVKSGATVLGADLLYQGEFLKDGEPVKQTRTVANNREAPAYTFGYNHALFAQRTHDILTLVKFIRTEKIDSIPSPIVGRSRRLRPHRPHRRRRPRRFRRCDRRCRHRHRRLPLRQTARLSRSAIPARRGEVSRSARLAIPRPPAPAMAGGRKKCPYFRGASGTVRSK